MPDSVVDLGYSRRSVNRGPESYGTYSTRQKERGFFERPNSGSRFGISSGITTVQGRSGTSVAESYRNTLYLGVTSDLHFGYAGVDLDLYYGKAGVESPVATGFSRSAGTLEQYGGLLNANFELPIDLPGILIVPKAGPGYGLMSVTFSQAYNLSFAPTAILSSDQLVHGAYLFAGGHVEIMRFLLLSADYSFSVVTGGRFNGGVNTVNIELGAGRSRFNRLRAGVSFRIFPNVLLGFQFIQRQVIVDLPVGLGSFAPKQQHYFGVLAFEL